MVEVDWENQGLFSAVIWYTTNCLGLTFIGEDNRLALRITHLRPSSPAAGWFYVKTLQCIS